MTKRLSHLLSLLLVFGLGLFLSNCKGVSSTNSTHPALDSSSLPEPETENTPVATVPSLPSALKLSPPNSTYIVSNSADSSGTIPVTGYAGAVDPSSCPAENTCEVMVSLTSNAIIDTTTNICNQTGVACCPPNADGSFQCYLPSGTTGMTLYISYANLTDPLQTSIPATDISNPSLLWLTTAPTDLKEANGNIYSATVPTNVGNTTVVKISQSGPQWMVNGSYLDGYLNFKSHGPKLAFHSEHSLFGEMNGRSGTYLSLVAELVTDTGLKSTQSNAIEYTVEKYVNGNLMYGIAEKAAKTAYLYNALDHIPLYDPDPLLDNRLQFIAGGDKDAYGNQLIGTRVLTFDMNSSGWAVIVHQDENGNNRIRLSNGTTMMGGKKAIPHTASHAFKEVGFINEEPLSGQNRILLLDSLQNKVWVLNANTFSSNFETTLDASVNGVFNNPVAMVFNKDKSRAYVVNFGDETVTVIAIPANRTIIPEVVATIRLSDLTPGKTISFKPSTLVYKEGTLLIGAEGIKSAVVLNTALIKESSTPLFH